MLVSKPSYVNAYQAVCQQPDPYKIYDILNWLKTSGLNIHDSHFEAIVSPEYYRCARAHVQQVLLRSQRLKANPKIMQYFAGYKGPYTIAYPNIWRNILKKHGLKIRNLSSGLVFFYAQVKQ